MSTRKELLSRMVWAALAVLGAWLMNRGVSFPGNDEGRLRAQAGELRAESRRIAREGRVMIEALKGLSENQPEFHRWVWADADLGARAQGFALTEAAFTAARAGNNTAQFHALQHLVLGSLCFSISLLFLNGSFMRRPQGESAPPTSARAWLSCCFGYTFVLTGASSVACAFLYVGYLDHELEAAVIRRDLLETEWFSALRHCYELGGISGAQMLAEINDGLQEPDGVVSEARADHLRKLLWDLPDKGRSLCERYQAKDQVDEEVAEAEQRFNCARYWKPSLLRLGLALIPLGFCCTFFGYGRTAAL